MLTTKPMCFVDAVSLPSLDLRPPMAISPKAVLASDVNEASGRPVVIGSTIGFLYPGKSRVGILMLSAIGFEEMCLRSTWRSLAGEMSIAGLPCLRFDYPGTGDALDVEAPQGIDDWLSTARLAAQTLRTQSGCERLILLGQGFGGAIAASIAKDIGDVDACVFMAPVINGKRYLRELSAWARMLTTRIGIEPDPDDTTGCAVAGLALPEARLAAISKMNLFEIPTCPAPRALLVGRQSHAGETAFVTQLEKLGMSVSRIDYSGIDNLMTDPTQATPPKETIARVVEWVRETASEIRVASYVKRPLAKTLPTRLAGDHFVERPVRFGEGERLFGVLCQPIGRSHGPTVVFVNAGRDYHIGWARVTIAQARALAAEGIASIRFDLGGIGDSLPSAETKEVLYSDEQILDVRAALDFIDSQGLRHPILVGRCSGAYAAFNTAVADDRVKEVIMINIERFVWDPNENVDDALRYAHRSIGDLGATLRRPGGMMRLLRGNLRVAAVTRYLWFRALKQLSIRLAPYLKGLTKQGRLYEEVHRRMRVLTARGVSASLVFSDNDIGLMEFHRYFSVDGDKIARYPQVEFALVPDADHNFTHQGARDRLLVVLKRIICI